MGRALSNPINKAKKIRPTGKFDHFGRYRVSRSSGGYYTVTCNKSDELQPHEIYPMTKNGARKVQYIGKVEKFGFNFVIFRLI
ncbi:MAG: hypothetical protein M3367_17940 [Acidobacteriota bacterium]|nr:hypothetical protein [Acidobacteriota bacterium]